MASVDTRPFVGVKELTNVVSDVGAPARKFVGVAVVEVAGTVGIHW